MKLIICALLCFAFSVAARAQNNFAVKGSVSDTSLNVKLTNATVCVLNAKDSTLRKFVRTAAGNFAVNGLAAGNFILLVSYPGYADYVERFDLDQTKSEHDFGNVYMSLKSKLLHDVIVKGTVAAIKIKGDTTVFDPRAYTIQANAKVEDLLKQLPGIQVDKDGKITAQGQTVQKVLVDGEEFFGDDPTLVTKNLRADMVDKVELYDKKSDQAAFTGIDDGKKTKTINVKLKEDKKNGYFGKLDGGIATDKYYSAQALYNRFFKKTKIAAYGITSNTGKIGLGWEDSNKYGTSGAETNFTDDGGIYFSINGDGTDLDSFNGRYDGRGIPVARSGGVHYDTKWNEDKRSVNTNYKAGWLGVTGTASDLSQNTVQGSRIKSNSGQDYSKSIFRQKLDLTYQLKLDSMTNLKIMVDGTLKNSDDNDHYTSNSRNGGDTLLNNNERRLTNKVNGQLFDASALFTKKLKKAGRTLSANFAANVNNSDAKGFLNSQIDYYNRLTAGLDSTVHTDQYKTTFTRLTNLNTNATYTEPISKKLSFIANYGLSNVYENADRRSFNQSAPGNYNVLDPRYSNDYTVNQLANQLGATFNYHTAKTTLNTGIKTSLIGFRQTDEFTGAVFNRHFINWNPNATFQYRFNQQRSVRLTYSGYTQQPDINQLQPVRVNNDPLNIYLGNPALTPAFRSNFDINYNSYKVLSDRSIYLYGNFSFTNNAIVSNNTSDRNTGKSTYQSVNLTGKTPYDFYLDVSGGQKLGFLGLNVNFSASGNGSQTYNYVTTINSGIASGPILNATHSNSYSGRLSISKYVEKKYDFWISGGPGYTFSGTSLQPNINNNGYTFSGYSYVNVYLPGKVEINTDGNLDYRGKTQTFDQTFSKFIINASLVKKLLKENNLRLALSINDLLNQNQGFERNAYNGTITQSTYTTIKRYFMFSITWDFSQMGGAPVKK